MSKVEKRQPWLKWYPADWRAEPRLKMVSRAARSLWIDMIGLMHEAESYGFLIVAGMALTDAPLIARVLGDGANEIGKLLAELAQRGVFSRVGDADIPPDITAVIPSDIPAGTIFSRKMVRDKHKADIDRLNGGNGGNPRLNPGVNPPLNPPLNHPVNGGDKAQIPDTRYQRRNDADASHGDETTRGKSPQSSEPFDPNAWLFGPGLEWLSTATRKSPSALRGILGKWRKSAGDDVDTVRQAIEAAMLEQPAEPVAWVTAAIAQRRRQAAQPFEAADRIEWERRLSSYQRLISEGNDPVASWPPRWGGTGPMTHPGHSVDGLTEVFAKFGFQTK